jgi:hypothetical protein
MADINVVGKGVTDNAVKRVHSRLRRRAARQDGTIRVVVFDGGTVGDLGEAMAETETDGAAFVDAACADHASLPAGIGALALIVSTAAATRLDVAEAFARAAGHRFGELAPLHPQLREALQEAVGNAVMHGNLGLDGRLRGTFDELRNFAAEMERRLGDPSYANRPITLTAARGPRGTVVSVEDSGDGFVPQQTGAVRPAAGGGNGLAIIRDCCRKVTFARGGRRITMLFDGHP